MIRIVVQRVYQERICLYRLIAYGSGNLYKPIEFSSLEEVVEMLLSVAPELVRKLVDRAAKHKGACVILSENATLADPEIATLGLQIANT